MRVQYLGDGHVPDGTILFACPKDKSQPTLLHDQRKSPTYCFPRPGSLAFLQGELRHWHRRVRRHLQGAVGPRKGPVVAHTIVEPCTSSHTSLDVNVVHHGGLFHHSVGAGFECPCLRVEA